MQLPSGEMINGVVPAGLSDDEVKSYVRMKRPDLFGAPAGVQAPANPIRQALNDPSSRYYTTNIPGSFEGSYAHGDTDYGATMTGLGTAIGGTMLGAKVPFLRNAVGGAIKAIPTIAAMEGINYARQKLPWGKYIPAGAEWLPVFMGGKGGAKAAAEKEAGAETEAATPTPKSSPITRQQVGNAVDESLGVQPLQRDVPLREQLPFTKQAGTQLPPGHTPVESSAISSHRYNADAREFEVTTKSNPGTVYVYGDVSPEQAQAFGEAESKGKAFSQIKSSSPLVGKVTQGKRISVKPQGGNDLTDILTRSLEQTKRNP